MGVKVDRRLLGRALAENASDSVGRSLIKHSIRQELRSHAEAQFQRGAIPGAMIQAPQVPQVVSVQPPVVSELSATAKP
jgi:hypothetical protein